MYANVTYKTNKKKVEIICPEHGLFKQRPNDHLSGQGCRLCGINLRADKKRMTKKLFVEKSNSVHKNKYDYSKVDYENNKTKITIICQIHGEFEQNPGDHLKGVGCPNCNESKGEAKIEKFLYENKIVFERQKTFKKCMNKRKLLFDFYLPEYNTCIEYDGIQHFKPIKFFGGQQEFEKTKKRDKIKEDFCLKNKKELLRINYKEISDIEKILNRRLES